MTLIRPATLEEVEYIADLATKESYALGFLPKVAYEAAITGIKTGKRWSNTCRDVLLVCEENDELVGFLLGGQGKTAKITQICLQQDARQMERGKRLVEAFVSASEQKGIHDFSCGCADDLESNKFWQAIGWSKVSERTGKRNGFTKAKSNRPVNIYLFQLHSLFPLSEISLKSKSPAAGGGVRAICKQKDREL